MSADSKMIAVLKAEVELLKARVDALEGSRSESPAAPVKVKKAKKERDPNAPKKEANSWIKFTSRVNDILKANEGKLPGAEQKQFASSLKDKLIVDLGKQKLTEEDYASISEEAILEARQSWVKPEVGKWAAAHPEGKASRKNSTASSTKSDAEAATVDVGEEVAEKPKKTRGRPKKVKEAEKAAAPVVVAPSAESDSDDDDEEENIEDVEVVIVNGKEYYKSEYNDLFDSDSMAYIGVLNGKKILNVPAAARVTEYLKKANL